MPTQSFAAARAQARLTEAYPSHADPSLGNHTAPVSSKKSTRVIQGAMCPCSMILRYL